MDLPNTRPKTYTITYIDDEVEEGVSLDLIRPAPIESTQRAPHVRPENLHRVQARQVLRVMSSFLATPATPTWLAARAQPALLEPTKPRAARPRAPTVWRGNTQPRQQRQ
jgi:hypothetical protein